MSGVCQARCWPPSTAIIWPVTSSASTSQRTAAATASGLPARLQRHGAGLGLELRRGLMDRGQGRAGPDAVDPDARRQRLRQRPRRPPQAVARQGVGEEARIGLQHPLVQQVDDGRPVRRLFGEGLGQHDRRAQIGRPDARPSSRAPATPTRSSSNTEALLTSTASGRPMAGTAAGIRVADLGLDRQIGPARSRRGGPARAPLRPRPRPRPSTSDDG